MIYLCRFIAFLIIGCLSCTGNHEACHALDQQDFDLTSPLMTRDAPSPGKRVRMVAPEYEGTGVHHSLYLPTDWEPGNKYPVLVEFTGNRWSTSGSTGKVEDANLGYGLSAGQGFIWVVLPCVDREDGRNALTWWGDRDATIDYCKRNVPRICKEFGGDVDNVFVCGFSRGSIATSYIGLADDEIASLWKGFITHDHFDGERTDWDYPNCDRDSAVRRLKRIAGRPFLVCGLNSIATRERFLKDYSDLGDFRFLQVDTRSLFNIPEGGVVHPHTDLWMHKPGKIRNEARNWLANAASIPIDVKAKDTVASKTSQRPNIVWIVSDDLGPELGCYGYPDVNTPNLDRLADEGTRYNFAFSTSPVCSASRTAFQTGQYQTTVGGHHHVTRDKPILTKSTPTIVDLMRDAGYFVSNGRGTLPKRKKEPLAKTHFNFVYDKRTFFDGSDWTQRREGQPFFAQIQIKEPHRTFHKSDRLRPDAPIPPYYPEHPITRADWSNYLASIEVLDRKVGAVLDRLDAEGLSDNTLVMFFGDHGRPHVRAKQWLYDGGLHTPLIVRWPERVKAGSVNDELVSLLDLVPTTLAAANVTVSEEVKLQGANLLSPDFAGHSQLFAARDRCGDAIDRIRSIRTREYKYIRNFRPELPYLQHSGYKKLQYPVETLMRSLHDQGQWSSLILAKERPPEELYDLKADPWELVNLASDIEQQERLGTFRKQLARWIVETKDLGEIDESLTVDMKALKEEKWQYYSNGMKKRGLDPDISDATYLQWWRKELGIER